MSEWPSLAPSSVHVSSGSIVALVVVPGVCSGLNSLGSGARLEGDSSCCLIVASHIGSRFARRGPNWYLHCIAMPFPVGVEDRGGDRNTLWAASRGADGCRCRAIHCPSSGAVPILAFVGDADTLLDIPARDAAASFAFAKKRCGAMGPGAEGVRLCAFAAVATRSSMLPASEYRSASICAPSRARESESDSLGMGTVRRAFTFLRSGLLGLRRRLPALPLGRAKIGLVSGAGGTGSLALGGRDAALRRPPFMLAGGGNPAGTLEAARWWPLGTRPRGSGPGAAQCPHAPVALRDSSWRDEGRRSDGTGTVALCGIAGRAGDVDVGI